MPYYEVVLTDLPYVHRSGFMLSVTSFVLKLELWLILQMTGASDLSFEKKNLSET